MSHAAGSTALWRPRDQPLAVLKDIEMEWVLFVSLQWIVFGSPTQPISQLIQPFASEELCNKAAEAIRNEINAPLSGNQRVQTLARIVCVLRKND
jgi:hypothetical protein